MVLGSTEHLVGILGGREGGGGARGFGTRWDVVPCTRAPDLTTGTLTTSGSGEADVGVANLIEHTAVTVTVLARGGITSRRLAEGNAGLKDGTLHVINEDGKVTRSAVSDLARIAVVWSWELGGGGILTVATGWNVGSVNRTARLVVGEVVGTIILGSVNQLGPVLNLHGVVLTISQVGDGWSGREVLVESMVGLGLTIRGEDGDMVVVVSNELGRIDPPAADTLLRIVKLEIVPGIELDSEHLVDSSVTVHEATGSSGATASIVCTSDSAQSAHDACFAKDTVVVHITIICRRGDIRAAMTSPVVTLLDGLDLGVSKTRSRATDLNTVCFLNDEGKTITATTEPGWVEYRVTADREASHAELETGLKTVVNVHLGGVEDGTLGLVLVRREAHDSL